MNDNFDCKSSQGYIVRSKDICEKSEYVVRHEKDVRHNEESILPLDGNDGLFQCNIIAYEMFKLTWSEEKKYYAYRRKNDID